MFFPLDNFCDFTDEQKKTLQIIRKDNNEELKSWVIFTAFLPLTTFVFAACVNALLSKYFLDEWSKFLNNGSLPIISFGIVSSALSYLVDKLTGNNNTVFELRKRVTAIALVLLFITSSLFILQSLAFIAIPIWAHIIVLLVSILFTIYSVQLGKLMFILQSSFANAFMNKQEASLQDMQQGLTDTFADVL